ncbi:hypothetical protein ABK040_009659 [Willaertia magna]
MSFAGDDVGAIVVDIGSYTTKAGFAGEETPKALVPSVVGIEYDGQEKSKIKDYYIGNKEISYVRPYMEIESIYDIETGELNNFDHVERIMHYVYDERLGIKSNDHPLLMSEVPYCSNTNREKLTSLMFEKFNLPSFFLSKQPVLSCFANGKYTALVIDSGYHSTTVTPVHDGYVLQKSIVRNNKLGGKFIDEELRKVLKQKRGGKDVLAPHQFRKQRNSQHASTKGAKVIEEALDGVTKSFNDYFIEKVVSDTKIQLLRVADEKPTPQQAQSTPVVTWEMSDGNDVDIGFERFELCEHLFSEQYGLHKLAYDAINKSDTDIRKDLYSNLILTGGNTLFPNTPKRLELELGKLAPSNIKVKPPLNTKNSNNIHSLASSVGANQTTSSQLQTARNRSRFHKKSQQQKATRAFSFFSQYYNNNLTTTTTALDNNTCKYEQTTNNTCNNPLSDLSQLKFKFQRPNVIVPDNNINNNNNHYPLTTATTTTTAISTATTNTTTTTNPQQTQTTQQQP